MSTANREFWTQDDDGHDICVAITHFEEEAHAVWNSMKRARDYVEEREHKQHIYKGKFLRSWSREDGMLLPGDLKARGIVP